MKYEFPKAEVTATDISGNALEIATYNARVNHKENAAEIKFLIGDMLQALKEYDYDVVVSNPPYVTYEEEVMDIVKQHEPQNAVYAEENGLLCYKKLFLEAPNYVKKKSLIALEIGAEQGQSVSDLAKEAFPESIVRVEQDMQQRDRFVFVFNGVNPDDKDLEYI
ncbi:Release factor glutamine methyltransferase [compost metagenome]